jgi:hypothetical protein
MKDRIQMQAEILAARQALEQDAKVGIPEEPEDAGYTNLSRPPKAEQPAKVPTNVGDKVRDNLISMTFKSSSGGEPHIVTRWFGSDGVPIVQCTCLSMRAVFSRPQGCWAMVAFRQLAGIEEPSN